MMISCIMPTYNRRRFVLQSIEYLVRQDYSNIELIVVDDGTEPVDDLVDTIYSWQNPYHRHVDMTYFGLPVQVDIGTKRNIACALASGDIICHWDDDDYYGPQRISMQAEPILAGRVDVTACRMMHLLNARNGTLWACSEAVQAALFAHNVRSGTLMYKASYWREGLRYENRQTGEDAQFLSELLAVAQGSKQSLIRRRTSACGTATM